MDDAVLSLEEALKNKTFLVKSYQRGYRWTGTQVGALLQDIAGFARGSRESDSYFLQPVIVKRLKKEDGSESWELIDGQQRLTTIFLMDAALCRALNRSSALSFKLRYENREKSGEFLCRLAREPEWAESAEGQREAGKNPDFHYMARACLSVTAFFREHTPDEALYEAFSRRVRVLWYDVTEEEGSAEQRFARLNMGRIPLTGAELCRALLISRAGREDGHPGADKRHASGLYADRSQILLGSLWDDMERSLHEPSFRDFLGLDGDDSGAPRLGFLLDIVTGRPHGDPDDQFAFRRMSERLKQGESARSVWNDLVLSWQLLRFWHEDNDLYHWTGCLISEAVRRGRAVPCLQHMLALARENKKSVFRKKLLEEIRTVMFGGNALPDLHSLRYDSDYDRIRRLLFLFNVELSREKGRRFPFGEHRRQSWSLEHIQAQNVESLTNVRDQTNWVRAHLDELRQMSPDALTKEEKHMSDDEFMEKKSALAASCSAFLKKDDEKKSMEDFDALYNAVLQFLHRVSGGSEERTHTLGNLALLDGGSNSSLNNAIFAVKRTRLLNMMRQGTYVPLGTAAVFLRAFTQEHSVSPCWIVRDMDDYEREIERVLSAFCESQGGIPS